MATQPTEQRASDDKSEMVVDATVEDTFPASDPPSTGGETKSGADKNARTQTDSDVPGTEPDEDVPDEETPPRQCPALACSHGGRFTLSRLGRSRCTRADSGTIKSVVRPALATAQRPPVSEHKHRNGARAGLLAAGRRIAG